MEKKFESVIEREIFNKFESSLDLDKFSLIIKDRWLTSNIQLIIDLVIYRESNPFAVVEIKGPYSELDNTKELVTLALAVTNARFGIITNGLDFYLYDRNEKDKGYEKVSFDKVTYVLNNPSEIFWEDQVHFRIQQIIIEASKKFMSKNTELIKLVKSKKFLEKIKFDATTFTFHFVEKNNEKSYEDDFFNVLLDKFQEDKICRYTSLRTIFEMLNNSSFRMNGLVGMNDKSEVNYFDSYLNGHEKPFSKESPSRISALNERYITSCTSIEKKDELTLWRLYSDDARGVCLVFAVNRKKLNSHVLLQKVSYADEDGIHCELEFLKSVKFEVEKLTGFTFEFRKANNWKHFFKPYEYSIEEEVRLLIIDKPLLEKISSNWLMTYSHSIISPYIDFKLNGDEFPIQLTEIILGPKCPEQETNVVQIKEMIKRKSKSKGAKKRKIGVSVSTIKHYR